MDIFGHELKDLLAKFRPTIDVLQRPQERDFDAQQNQPGFAQLKRPTTWKEEECSFFQVVGFWAERRGGRWLRLGAG